MTVPSTGEVLAERVLLHPHIEEQPFTRGLTYVRIPRDLRLFLVRARTNLTGYSGRQVEVDLRIAAGVRYSVDVGAPESGAATR